MSTRDESRLGIPMGPMDPMGIPLDWESLIYFHGNENGNALMGMGGNKNPTFSHFQSWTENQLVSGATSASPRELRRTVTHVIVIAHQLRSTVSSTLMISATQAVYSQTGVRQLSHVRRSYAIDTTA